MLTNMSLNNACFICFQVKGALLGLRRVDIPSKAFEFDVRPSEKKCKATFDNTICIFCAQPFHKTPGDLSKIDS